MHILFWQTNAARVPRAFLIFLSAICAGALAGAPRAFAEAVVGIYSQPTGSGCTLSDTGPGYVDGYVVVRPTGDGLTGVQFSAPLPSCFTGSYVGDQSVPGTLVIGDSQNGITVSLTTCTIVPTHVLTIRAFGFGTTPACCQYPVLPDPLVSTVITVDCFFQEEAASAVISVINSDPSCPCSDNRSPFAPTSPNPANFANNVPVTQTLAWSASDPEGDPLTFDLYLGTTATPPLVASDLATPGYAPALDYATQYYWRVVARDPAGGNASSELWQFNTRAENSPPSQPQNPIPANGATGQAVDVSIEWTATDIDDDVLTYDVYFGDTSPPPLVAGGQPANSYSPPNLLFSTNYYWHIVVHDSWGHATSGPEWGFTTRPVSYPPSVSSPVPANNATTQPLDVTLQWAGTDPDDDPLVYDVYLGTAANSQPLVAGDLTDAAYQPGTLGFGTFYYWKVVARDPYGLESASPVWRFTTRLSNYPPNAPTNPVPANGSTNRPVSQVLSWTCTDPDGDPLTYGIYYGTVNPPPLVTTGLASPSFDPDLVPGRTYYWRVLAQDDDGAVATSATWSFSTQANRQPNVPTSPSPSNGGKLIAAAELTWIATDPDGDALTYDVYFGDATSPPLAASGLTTRHWPLPPLDPLTRYYWRVVSSDGFLTRSGPEWYFDTVLGGDVNGDGTVTVADAACAFRVSLYDYACVGSGAAGLAAADVDCSGQTTPRDARCIHKHALDGTCAFCGDGGAGTPSPSFAPQVSVGSTWEDHDTLVVELRVSGVPAFESFWFDVRADQYGDPLPNLLRVERRGVCAGWTEMGSVWTSFAAVVGGYTVGSSNAGNLNPFVRLRFLMQNGQVHVVIGNFADDLAGVQTIAFNHGGDIPVLISRFDADLLDGAVALRWTLAGDEDAERFTVLRGGDDGGAPVAIGEGAVTSRDGSFVDSRVEPGATYRYTLLVRTSSGDEFRSPEVVVTTPSNAFALGQNHPNPFNPTTVIPYTLANGSVPVHIRLSILDVSGGVVRTLIDEDQPGGPHEVTWDGRDDRGGPVSSGIYFYVLDANGKRQTRKMVLLK